MKPLFPLFPLVPQAAPVAADFLQPFAKNPLGGECRRVLLSGRTAGLPNQPRNAAEWLNAISKTATDTAYAWELKNIKPARATEVTRSAATRWWAGENSNPMKTVFKATSVGQKLGLVTSIITLVGGVAANAQLGLFLNETFDPPTLVPLSGWEWGGAGDITREYVNGGFAGSTAVKISATFTGAGGFGTMLYHKGDVRGNDLATAQTTVLSFMLKVDQPGLTNVAIVLEGWSLYSWNGSKTSSGGYIPLGSYTPGKFQTLVVPLDDPLWFPMSALPPFDPTAKTCQITLYVLSGDLQEGNQVAVTVDNLRLSTSNFMLPWKLTSTGQMTVDWGTGAATALEVGSSTLLGDYTSVIQLENLLADVVTGPVELTADNGDKLFGQAYGIEWEPTQIGVVITSGTGRFQGATGSYVSTITWTEFLASYTATANGGITSVGSNK